MTTCKICTKELHSITTRKVGSYDLCMDCGDPIIQYVNKFADSTVDFIAAYYPENHENGVRPYLAELGDRGPV